MAPSEHSGPSSDASPLPARDGANSPAPDVFTRALAAYEQGVSTNNAGQIEAAAWEVMTFAAAEAAKNPTPELLWKNKAGECESRGDWLGAEDCYRQALALEEATGHSGFVCKTQIDLSRLFLLTGDMEKATACAEAATVAARRVELFAVLFMALENQAICALRREDYAAALEAATEAVTIIKTGRMHEGMRAGALVLRARCRMACGDRTGAREDLAECKLILIDRPISPILAGLHNRAAAWWEVTAEVRARNGDSPGSCQAWEEAVKFRRHLSSLAHVSGPYTLAALARTLRRWSEALDAAGKPEESKTFQAESQRIWSELGLPG